MSTTSKSLAAKKGQSVRLINRAIGLLAVEIINSNLNGDPDTGGAPRIRPDGKAEVSAVSTKRKCRDTMRFREGPVFTSVINQFGVDPDDYRIFEDPDRSHADTTKLVKSEEITEHHWDSRVFGGMFLHKADSASKSNTESGVAARGTVQVGMGVSILPVNIRERTITRGMPVEEKKSRGMGPQALKSIDHALVTIPFFVNPSMALRNHTTLTDIDILKIILPYIYPESRSASRPEINLIHAHWVEHADPLGRVPDYKVFDILMPRAKLEPDQASTSLKDYSLPTEADILKALKGLNNGDSLTYSDLSIPSLEYSH